MKTHNILGIAIDLSDSSRSCEPGYTGVAGNMVSFWLRVNGGKWMKVAGAFEWMGSRFGRMEFMAGMLFEFIESKSELYGLLHRATDGEFKHRSIPDLDLLTTPTP